VEIVTVNYNTPDLVDRLIKSVREVEGDYPIRIIDGSTDKYAEELKLVVSKYENVSVEYQGWNIHHGRGMDLALRTSTHDKILFIDSDNFIKKPIISLMVEQKAEIVSWYCYVNKDGLDSGREPKEDKVYKYFHPSFMLIDVKMYRESKSKFIHHGAPCIEFMLDHQDVFGVDIAELLGVEFHDLDNYISIKGRGTVNRFGYNLR
jgi:hypothetical protein